MSKQSYTPGPWSVHETSTHVAVVANNGEYIFHEYKRFPNVIGDAHLIAAAPDLLEALQELVAAHNESAGFSMSMAENSEDFYRFLQECERKVEQATSQSRAAIAKALGE